MKLEIEKFLDHVDAWKVKLHGRLKRMSPTQRKAFWAQIREDARARGLTVVEPKKKPVKRLPQTG